MNTKLEAIISIILLQYMTLAKEKALLSLTIIHTSMIRSAKTSYLAQAIDICSH